MDDHGLKRLVLLIAILASFLTPFMSSAINIALPTISHEFDLDAVSLGWVASSYLLAAAVFLVPFGRLADIRGQKRIFLWGVVVYTAASVLCALAPTGWLLIAFRMVQGIGGAMTFGTGTAMLISVFPPGERGKALGLNIAAVYLGLSLGPTLGGLLTQQLGWRSIFWVNVPLGILIVILVLWRLRGEWAEARGEGFDLVGSIVYGLALAAVMLGFSRLPQPLGVGLLFAGLVGLLLFGLWEMRITHPVLDIRLFRHNRAFAFSNLAALINYSATYAVGFLLSLYLQYMHGLSPQEAGLILVAQPAIQAVFSPLAGRVSDRVEPRVVASAGMAITVVGLLLLVFVGAGTPLSFIVFSLALLGLGFALFSSPNTHAVMSAVDKRRYGVASGTLATMRLTGQTLSLGITMLVFALIIGSAQITPTQYEAFVQSMHIILAIMTGLCAVGVFASLVRGRMR
ncbi:MAG: MFS transporter [Chloroflexi bacterium]|nr:MFS transporter [Chloroflexota bacterium]MBU1748688.1 MFS transporter [Chloroflexota bacterium]